MEQLPKSEATRQTLAEINVTLRGTGAVLSAMRGVIGEGQETLRATDTLLAFFQTRGVSGESERPGFERAVATHAAVTN
jgi:hypothetical protein